LSKYRVLVSEPSRTRPPEEVGARFSSLRRTDTAPELLLRQELHARGLRYRVQARVPGLPRRRIDILFTKHKLAVSVDGCFWHGCPDHWIAPKNNAEWWLWKVRVNQERDADTDRILASLGYTSLRIWEHVPPRDAADLVMARLNELKGR